MIHDYGSHVKFRPSGTEREVRLYVGSQVLVDDEILSGLPIEWLLQQDGTVRADKIEAGVR